MAAHKRGLKRIPTAAQLEALAKFRKPWKPGKSANPLGRPASVTARIRDICGDHYERIWEALGVVAFGTDAERFAVFGRPLKFSARDVLLAVLELRDSGPGRPIQKVELDARSEIPAFSIEGYRPSVAPRQLPSAPVVDVPMMRPATSPEKVSAEDGTDQRSDDAARRE
jgi:hypothetical protein